MLGCSFGADNDGDGDGDSVCQLNDVHMEVEAVCDREEGEYAECADEGAVFRFEIKAVCGTGLGACSCSLEPGESFSLEMEPADPVRGRADFTASLIGFGTPSEPLKVNYEIHSSEARVDLKNSTTRVRIKQ